MNSRSVFEEPPTGHQVKNPQLLAWRVKAATARDPHANEIGEASDCTLLFRSQPAEWKDLSSNRLGKCYCGGFDYSSFVPAVLSKRASRKLDALLC
jgi:hypothetical protein